MTHIFCYQTKLFSRDFLVFRFFHNLFCYLFICHLTERSNLQQHVKSIHDGVKHVNLSIMELNTVVSSVTIRQLWKAAFSDMWSLSMMELNIVVSYVNIRQVGKVFHNGVKYSCECCDYIATTKATFKHIFNLSMKEFNIVVSVVTI